MGLQDTLLQHNNRFFSWTISCGRSFHKAFAATSAVKRDDGKDETRIREAKKAAMAAEADTTQGQRPPKPNTPVVLVHPQHGD